MKSTSDIVELRRTIIPPHKRIGLSRFEAAEFIGVSPRLFDQMVHDGRMPQPKLINSRKVWHRHKIEKAFAELPEPEQTGEDADPWKDCA